MHKHLKRDMIRLSGRLSTLGEIVRSFMARAVSVISGETGDGPPADWNLSNPMIELDEASANVDEECLKIIALHQPDENTLRHITGAIKLAHDLKKAGETAVSLAKRLDDHGADQSALIFSADDALIAQEVLSMFDRTLSSFVTLDGKLAGEIILSKTRVGEMVRKAHLEAEQAFHSCAGESLPMIRRLHVLGQLEMIADNCVNACIVTTGLAERKVPASMKPEDQT